MEKLEFTFELEDQVRTNHGQNGIVKGVYFDKAGIQYSVQIEEESHFFKENDLKFLIIVKD